MAGRLASFRRLCPAERRALVLAAALLAVAPLLIRLVPLPRLLALVPPRAGAGLGPERLAELVTIAARYVPGAHCLPVALVTAWLLARHGFSPTLSIGVARHADRLLAHAWLECLGRPLLGPEGYTPILAARVASS
jgi:hypothetical protein